MLTLKKVNAGYGHSHVLHDVDLEFGENQIVALLGRNGVGKTTTFNAIMGLVPVTSGRILFDGHDLTRLPARSAALLGMALCRRAAGSFPNSP